MRLHYLAKEGKVFLNRVWSILILAGSIFGAYGLGFLSASETLKLPIYVEKEQEIVELVNPGGKYIVASKSGSKFYFTWCGGVNRIKEENKVYFDTKEEAIKKGYEPAQNCPGL